MSSGKSMKKRIRRTINFSNFTGILIISVIMFIAVGFILKAAGFFISSYVSTKLSIELQEQLVEARENGILDYELDPDNPELIRIMANVVAPLNSFIKDMPEVDEMKFNFDALVNQMPFIRYRIFGNEKLLFENVRFSDNPEIINKITDENCIMGLMNHESVRDVGAGFKNIDLKLVVSINPNILIFIYLVIMIICVAVILISMLISKLFTMLLTANITKPLTDLQQKMYQLAEGDIESALHTEIELKKPIMEVEQLANITNMIMSRMQEYVEMMASQKEELEAQKEELESQKEELEAQNDALEENGTALNRVNLVLENRNQKLENILNNVGQGFLTFKSDLKIESEYSAVCDKTFTDGIKDRRFSELIFPEDEVQEAFVDDLFEKIMVSDISRRSLYIPLLPEEIEFDNRFIKIEYKMVEDEDGIETMMVILTDITEKRELEMKMDEERRILKMVVKAMVNREEFVELVRTFEHFIESTEDTLNESCDSVMRKIHTFKGNFSQYEMINLVPNLHALENEIFERGEICSDNRMFENMKSWLEKDLAIIANYIGRDFFTTDEMFHIEKRRIIEIEEKLKHILSAVEYDNVIPIIRSLRCKPLKDMLKTYPDYVMKLSERLEKSVKPFEVTGDDVMVDSQNYNKLVKSLVHVFRNAVDHGIEDEDERIETGKDIHGTIKCVIEIVDDGINILISDDGRGIDVEKVKGEIIDKNIMNVEECEKLSDEDIYRMLLIENITTKKEATQVSGRGVGLTALKEEIDSLNGEIEIKSKKGMGTEFCIHIPADIKSEFPVTPEEVLKSIVETTREYIMNQNNLDFAQADIEFKNKIELDRITSLMDIQGSVSAIVMLSVNREMGRKLVENFMYEKIGNDEIDELVEDVLGEVSNTIIGNSFGNFEYGDELLHMGVPAMISNEGAYVKYSDSDMLTCSLEKGEFKFSVHMINLENGNKIKEFKEEGIWPGF